ncbi:thiolase family protein [Streptomyces yaizuensis]|uniref:Ketoacyl-ACP synthase III family protein n=1 Tax=Streptomyces yaizuensis TaxID=2989713 RepID=A0ABQ5NY03_9ACTN|nr:hypothetical protein [Streptomyces sp. YSPA8]GLF95124.1 ketoacyl-ACP synthase III family protein [Streptomyces sp. YSPA8]
MRTDTAHYVSAAALWLPETASTAEEAVAAGTIRRRAAEAEGFSQVTVCHDRTVAAMAAEAARAALDDAGIAPGEVDLLIHAWVHQQGTGNWNPPHHVARLVGAEHAVALGLQQQSNGGAAAIEAALNAMAVDLRVTTALITTADQFTDIPQGRWSVLSDGGPLGDGGTAAVLTRAPGPLLIESIASYGDPTLEAEFPGRDPFGPPPEITDEPGSAFRNQDVLKRMRHCVEQAVQYALDDARLSPDAPTLLTVLPLRLGHTFIDWTVRSALPAPLQDKIQTHGSRTGHLGAGDLLANLADIVSRPPPPDSRILLVSVGAGYTATCLIVRT